MCARLGAMVEGGVPSKLTAISRRARSSLFPSQIENKSEFDAGFLRYSAGFLGNCGKPLSTPRRLCQPTIPRPGWPTKAPQGARTHRQKSGRGSRHVFTWSLEGSRAHALPGGPLWSCAHIASLFPSQNAPSLSASRRRFRLGANSRLRTCAGLRGSCALVG